MSRSKRRQQSRPSRRIGLRSWIALAFFALLVGGVLLVAIDWSSSLSDGELDSATYVGRDVCRKCHEEEFEAWTGSDHDLAMDPATPETVRGDFDDCRFTHIAVDDIAKLSDGDLRAVIANVDTSDWALALENLADSARTKVLAAYPAADRDALARARARLEAVRPSDVTDAHRRIGDVMRRLESQGKIDADFALTSHMFRRGVEFFITTDNREGNRETFPVKYTFGVRPLQQYLVEFPDGRVQCLPITWDTDQEAWFHLHPKEPIPASDMLHWTGPLQKWNYMCAECHSTNLEKGYDVVDDTYHTTWSEIDVSCETCHGPGSLHVQLAEAKSLFWDRRHGYGLPRLKSVDPRIEIETCAPCHSRRRVIYPGHRPGKPFLDHYVPEVLDNNLYYADGQILDEDYVYGSFLQSRMYQEKVRCTNCHDPHTARTKFPDNRLCGQCHVAAKYDTVTHHHHPDSSKPGTLCVECHMPETKYMVVDPRRDHSLRVPRPDLTVSLGIPNACNVCHQDAAKGENAAWAAEQIETWYGKPKPHFAHALAAGRNLAPKGESLLVDVIRGKETRPIVRASAISLLSRYRSGEAEFRTTSGLEDPDPLVRTLAARSLENLDLPELAPHLAPLLHDEVRSVRIEAARLLAAVPDRDFAEVDEEALEAALAEYTTGQEALDDQPAAHLNLAVVYANANRLGKARRAYAAALRLDPEFVPARVNLAMLCDRMGEKDQAEAQFRKVIEMEPSLGEAYYSLGLLLAENATRLEEATEMLGTAAELMPNSARVHYNHGLALQTLKRHGDAEAALKAALRLEPRSIDYLHALAILCIQTKNWPQARAYLEALAKLRPADPRVRAELEHVKREAERSKQTGKTPAERP